MKLPMLSSAPGSFFGSVRESGGNLPGLQAARDGDTAAKTGIDIILVGNVRGDRYAKVVYQRMVEDPVEG
jgi:hypothetical protein